MNRRLYFLGLSVALFAMVPARAGVHVAFTAPANRRKHAAREGDACPLVPVAFRRGQYAV